MQQQQFPCSRCGSQNYIGQPFCQNCGQQFQYNCPSCRAIVDSRFSICPNCGATLNWPRQQQVQPPLVYQQDTPYKHTQVEPKKKRNPWLLGCLIPIGIAVIIGAVVIAGSSGSHETESTTSTPEIEVSATKLYLDYTANEIAADAKYKDKILKVTGIVIDIGKGFFGTSEITLVGGDAYGLSGVRCEFNKDNESQLLQLSKGKKVAVQGKCTGLSIGYVNLENCHITEEK